MFDFDVVTGPAGLAKLAEAKARRGAHPPPRPAAPPTPPPGVPAGRPLATGNLALEGRSRAEFDPI